MLPRMWPYTGRSGEGGQGRPLRDREKVTKVSKVSMYIICIHVHMYVCAFACACVHVYMRAYVYMGICQKVSFWLYKSSKFKRVILLVLMTFCIYEQ